MSERPATGADYAAERPAVLVRWPVALAFACVAAAPFLLTAVPPLTDVPGHIGRFAVQTAPAGDPLLRYFGFHWSLTLNLASDLLVQLLHPMLGVISATWLLCALTPALTTAGLFAIARVLNRQAPVALPWALLFVFNYPFLWGFLNFALTAALALLAFAAWVALARRVRWRALLFLAITPLLLVGHGVAGVVGVGLIAGYTLGEAVGGRSEPWPDTLRKAALALRPLLVAALVTIVLWKAFGASDVGRTVWLPYRKLEAILMMVRDQNATLDVGTVVAALAIWVLGWRRGARLSSGAVGAVMFVLLLFVVTPSLLSGSDRIDTRLAPLIPMLALTLQDWSQVAPRRRRLALFSGFALLALRFGVTADSFAQYDRRYRLELTALDHMPRGARVLNLTTVNCPAAAWRSERLEHLANLATPLRGAWVNAHWSIAGLQLLQIRFRPSEVYSRDPSQLIWPASCVDMRLPLAKRDRRTLAESLPVLPLDRVDYLWLIDARLPPGYRDPRLRRVWADDMSELYATRPTCRPRSPPCSREAFPLGTYHPAGRRSRRYGAGACLHAPFSHLRVLPSAASPFPDAVSTRGRRGGPRAKTAGPNRLAGNDDTRI